MATLNDQPVTTCRVSVPAFGLAWAEVECASDVVQSGISTLSIDDVAMVCTVMSGGAYQTRTRYRVVAGHGGWGKVIPAKSYANDLGVKLALVLRDAALECGEVLGYVDPKATIGPSFTRARGPASQVLHELAPQAWYVDTAGVTQIGRRLSTPFLGAASRIVNDAAQVRYEIAPESGTLSSLVPGIVVDGVEAVDVEHAIDDTGNLRTTLWGRGIADTSRVPEAFRRIVGAITAGSKFHAPWEYRVVQRTGERLDLQATRVSSGMPDLRNVRVRPGVAGMRSHAHPGSLVLVQFVNGDPSEPRVVGFDDSDGAGAVADEIALQAGTTGSTAGATEHATSAEALVAFVFEALLATGALIAPTPLTPAQVQAGIAAALTAMSTATLGAVDVAPGSGATKAAIASLLAAKTADTGGDKPSLGWPAVRGG